MHVYVRALCLIYQVMVATVRCEEIANEKFDHLRSDEVCTHFSPFRDASSYENLLVNP